MPCYYCGKRVSLVRQISDGDFCSDEHRKRYHELTRLALNRLVKAQDQLATASKGPKGPGKGPVNGTSAPALVAPIAPPVPPAAGFLAAQAHDPTPPSRAGPVPVAEELRPAGANDRVREAAIQPSPPAIAPAGPRIVAPAAVPAEAHPPASVVPLRFQGRWTPATRSLPLGTPAAPALAIESAGARSAAPAAASTDTQARMSLGEPAARQAALPSTPASLVMPALMHAPAAHSRFAASGAGAELRRASAVEFSVAPARSITLGFNVLEEARPCATVPERAEAALTGPPAAITAAAKPIAMLVECSPAALVRGATPAEARGCAVLECDALAATLESAAEPVTPRIAGAALPLPSLSLAACPFGVVDESRPAFRTPEPAEAILAGPPAARASAPKPIAALAEFATPASVPGSAPPPAWRCALSECGVLPAAPESTAEPGVPRIGAGETFPAPVPRPAACAFGVVEEARPSASAPEPAEAILKGLPSAIALTAAAVPVLVQFPLPAPVRGVVPAQARRCALSEHHTIPTALESTVEPGMPRLGAPAAFPAPVPRRAPFVFGVVEEARPSASAPEPAGAILTGLPAAIALAPGPIPVAAEFSAPALVRGAAPAQARRCTLAGCDTLPAALESAAEPGTPRIAASETFPAQSPRIASFAFGVVAEAGLVASVPEPAEAILSGPPSAIALAARPIPAVAEFRALALVRGAAPSQARCCGLAGCDTRPEALESSAAPGTPRMTAGETFPTPSPRIASFAFGVVAEAALAASAPEPAEAILSGLPSATALAARPIPALAQFRTPALVRSSVPAPALNRALNESGPIPATVGSVAVAPGKPRNAADEEFPTPLAPCPWLRAASATKAPGPAEAILVPPAAPAEPSACRLEAERAQFAIAEIRRPVQKAQALAPAGLELAPAREVQATLAQAGRVVRVASEMPETRPPALPVEAIAPLQRGKALETAGLCATVQALTPAQGTRAPQAAAAPMLAPPATAAPGALATRAPETQWRGAPLLPASKPATMDRRCERSAPEPGLAFAAPSPASPAATLCECFIGSAGLRRVGKPMRHDQEATRNRVVLQAELPGALIPETRLPDFRSQHGLSGMPEGPFFLLEFEDHDDSGTGTLAPPVEPPVCPLIPSAEYRTTLVAGLAEGEPFSAAAPPCEGNRTPRGGRSEAAWPRPEFAVPQELSTGLAPPDYEFQGQAPSSRGQVWGALREAWRGASGLFKTLVVGIPGLLLASMLAWDLAGESLRQQVQNRAAIEIEDDFRSNLEGWFGGRDWSKQWQREPDGFVRVGALALYRPTLKLSDYRLELLGLAERGGLGWVIRAADLSNYYAMKVSILEAGPMPSLALVRYAVIGGQEGQRVQIPIRLRLHQGRPYKIQVRVEDTGFTTSIEGQVVDFWSDERLKTGGIGFFADGKDDRARVYWMKVAHNDDLLGHICALLAPNGQESAASAGEFERE